MVYMQIDIRLARHRHLGGYCCILIMKACHHGSGRRYRHFLQIRPACSSLPSLWHPIYSLLLNLSVISQLPAFVASCVVSLYTIPMVIASPVFEWRSSRLLRYYSWTGSMSHSHSSHGRHLCHISRGTMIIFCLLKREETRPPTEITPEIPQYVNRICESM